MRIIAYKTSGSNGKVNIQESTGERYSSRRLEDIFAFLLEPQSSSYWPTQYDGCLRVCWDLDETVAPILKLLGQVKCRKLYQSHKVYSAPFNIFYVPSKVFSVTHLPTKQQVSLYHLAQYFPELDEPGTVNEVEIMGGYLKRELKKMGMEPHKLTSPVAIYDDAVMSFIDLPSVKDIPKGACELAYKCAGKLWVEAHQVGFWGNAWEYDIQSSFPMVARDLIDIRQCDWVESDKYQEDAVYGYCEGVVTIKPFVNASPIIYIDENGELCSPTGSWETYLTKGEIDFIRKSGIGRFEIKDGWWATPNTDKLRYPLRNTVDSLLRYKARTGLQSSLAKRMAVGLYGRTLELRANEVGPYFNPCWGAEISSRVRLQVADFIYRHGLEDSLISVGVDGVLVDKETELDLVKDRGWRLSNVTPALVVSSGLVYTLGKKPQGLGFLEAMDMLRAKPREFMYQKPMRRCLTLPEAVEMGLDMLGTEVDVYTGFNLLTVQHDREFKRFPKTGRQLLNNQYKSKPRRV